MSTKPFGTTGQPAPCDARRRVMVLLVLLAAVILAAVGFYFFPWISDDLGYRQPFRDYYMGGALPSFRELMAHFAERCSWDNGRFANLTMIFLQFAPRWVHALGSAAALWLTLFYGLKIIGRDRSPAAAMLWVFAVVVLLPWVDQMYVFDFQLNYLWAGAFSTVLAYALLWRRMPPLALGALALLVGLWQESCGFPMFVGAVALWVFYPGYRDRRSAVVILCLLAGLAWLYLVPGGQLYRGSDWRPFARRSNMVLPFALPALALGAAVLLRCLRRRKVSAPVALLAVSSAASAAVMLASFFGPRVGWWSVLAGCLGLLGLLAERCRPGIVVKAAAAAAGLFVALHLVAVDRQSMRERRVYDRVVEAYVQQPDTTVFVEMNMRENAPLLCLQKPYFAILSHIGNVRCISNFYGGPDATRLKAVPEPLAAYAEGLGRPVAGDACLREFGGYLVGPQAATEPTLVTCWVDYGRGAVWAQLFAVPFVDAGGVGRSWYAMNTSTIDALLRPVPLRVDLL